MKLLSIIAMLLCCPILCFGQQKPPNKVRGSDQLPPATIQNQESPTGLVPDNATENKGKSNDQTTTTASDSPSNITIAHFTELLAIVAILQAVIYGIQCYMMKKALDQSRESSERALRAYVGVFTEGNDPEDFMTRELMDFPKSFTILMQNTGETPAYKVGSRVDWQTMKGRNANWPDNSPPNEEANRCVIEDEGPSHLTIGSGEKSFLSQELTPHADGSTIQEAFAKLKKGDVSIFLYGHISYRDIFDTLHHTQFCFVLRYCKTADYEIWYYNKYCDAD